MPMAVCLQGNKGNITRHDPPLLFDLATDVAEEFALDTSQPRYASIVAEITKTLAEQMHSVNNTFVRAPLDFPRRSCARTRTLAVSLTRGVVVGRARSSTTARRSIRSPASTSRSRAAPTGRRRRR